MFRRFARAYDAQLRKTPLPVKMGTSGAIICAADVSNQLFSAVDPRDRWASYSVTRTMIVGVGYGALWFAPILHFITTTWARVLPSQSYPALLLKTGVDMVTAFPLNTCASIATLSIARREPDIAARVRENVVPTVLDGWKFWPWYTMVMYGVVPLRFRVAFLNVGSFFWNSWLMFRFEREEAKRAGASSADPVLAPPTVAATQCNVEGR